MRSVDKKLSALISSQFPRHYREDGTTETTAAGGEWSTRSAASSVAFIAFVKAYYEWMEQTGQVGDLTRSLGDLRDIDKTIDDFLVHFKNKYLVDFPYHAVPDKRFVIKHALDLYRSKGSQISVELLIKLLYGEEVEIYNPGKDILRPSDGKYVIPRYLEVSITDVAASFVGKEIEGSRSGAKAIVESVDRQSYRGKMFDVIVLSNIRGNFDTGEVVTADGIFEGRPVVIGSLSSLEVVTAGRDFFVGEEVDLVSSRRGRGGRGRVASIAGVTGQVTFALEDGGFGYVKRLRNGSGTIIEAGSEAIVAEQMFGFTNATNSALPAAEVQFQDFEQVVQYKTSFADSPSLSWTNGIPASGASANGHAANGDNIASGGFVVSAANGEVIVTAANTVYNNTSIVTIVAANSTGGGTNAVTIGVITDVSTYGVVTDQNTSVIGFHSTTGSFTGNSVVATNFIHGLSSNTYAQLTTKYLGTQASFAIGSLDNEESVYVATDFIGGNNYADGAFGPGAPYLNIIINGNGYNSSVGAVISTSIVANGTGYVNGQQITVTGGSPHTAANLTIFTDASGNITSVNIVSTGYGYDSTPTLTLPGPGTGGNVQPVMSFGYGFPKLITGNYQTIINECLARETINIGTVSVISEINPGEQYNIDPFVRVYEPRIAGYNRKDLRVHYNNIANGTGAFLEDELIQQQFVLSNSYRFGITGGANGTHIDSITISYGGTGYANNILVNITDPTGTNAAAIASVANGAARSFNANTDIDNVNDFIAIANNTLQGNDYIYYLVDAGNTAITGLTANSNYYILAANTTGVTLSTTKGGALLPIAPGLTELGHYLIPQGAITTITVTADGNNYTGTPGTTLLASVTGGENANLLPVPASTFFEVGEAASQPQYQITRYVSAWSNGVPTVGNLVAGANSTVNTVSGGYILHANTTVAIVGFYTSEFGNTSIVTLDTGTTQGTVNSTNTSVLATINGEVVFANTTAMKAVFFENDYTSNTTPPVVGVNAFMNNAPVYGIVSGASANVSYGVGEPVSNNVIVATKGRIVAANSSGQYIDVRRLSFNLAFDPNTTITGSSTGTTANVVYVEEIVDSQPAGLNAVVSARAGTAEGAITGIDVVNSGTGYEQDEIVAIIRANSPYTSTVRANLGTQGVGAGYFKDTSGFLNSDKYIHDSDYYQEFSYEVRTGVSIDKYANTLKEVAHLAGSKFFGGLVKVMEFTKTTSVAESEIEII